MHPMLPVVAAVLNTVQQSHSDLKQLQGYGPYRFGMGIEDVKALTDILVVERTADGQFTGIGKAPINAFGLPMRPVFHFRGETLRAIRLEFAAPATRPQCVWAYRDAVDKMKPTFGSPASDPTSSSSTKNNVFSFEQDSVIRTQMIYRIPSTCGITILFQNDLLQR